MNGYIGYTDIDHLDNEAVRSVIVGPMGGPIEFRDIVAFLFSERTDDVNGIAVPIEGGAGATNH